MAFKTYKDIALPAIPQDFTPEQQRWADSVLNLIRDLRINVRDDLDSIISDDALCLDDGVTAPSTLSGTAFVYVDTSDGDLKVKFGDGTTKTIATDT